MLNLLMVTETHQDNKHNITLQTCQLYNVSGGKWTIVQNYGNIKVARVIEKIVWVHNKYKSGLFFGEGGVWWRCD